MPRQVAVRLEEPIIAARRKITVANQLLSRLILYLHVINIDHRAFALVVERQLDRPARKPATPTDWPGIGGERLCLPSPTASPGQPLPLASRGVEQVLLA